MIPFFFFNDTATTEIYTLSLHDALPICQLLRRSPFANQLDEPLPELRRVRPMALRHRGRSFPPQPWGVHGTGSTPPLSTAGVTGDVSVQGTGLAATDSRSGARSGGFGAERLTRSFPKE